MTRESSPNNSSLNSIIPSIRTKVPSLHDPSLEPSARPHVVRIVEIKPSGVVVMEGSDAARREEQKGEAKVREPRDQSMHGLCRDG